MNYINLNGVNDDSKIIIPLIYMLEENLFPTILLEIIEVFEYNKDTIKMQNNVYKGLSNNLHLSIKGHHTINGNLTYSFVVYKNNNRSKNERQKTFLHVKATDDSLDQLIVALEKILKTYEYSSTNISRRFFLDDVSPILTVRTRKMLIGTEVEYRFVLYTGYSYEILIDTTRKVSYNKPLDKIIENLKEECIKLLPVSVQELTRANNLILISDGDVL